MRVAPCGRPPVPDFPSLRGASYRLPRALDRTLAGAPRPGTQTGPGVLSCAAMGDAGQLSARGAEAYEAFFVPALFGAWPPHLVAAARLRPGMRVVDVACGTGILAVAAAAAVAPGGEVVGVDLNPGMLAVARRKAPGIRWLEAPAEALPLESDDFDAAVSQFGLMFFRDQPAAIREQWRVLRPGGRLAVAVWDALDHVPGYTAVTALLERLFGAGVADRLRAPFALGDAEGLRSLLESAGIHDPAVQRVAGDARFPSIRDWILTDVRAWTLGDALDDDQTARLVAEAEVALQEFVTADGSVRFDIPALIATARKP